jgi:hypothetical protein
LDAYVVKEDLGWHFARVHYNDTLKGSKDRGKERRGKRRGEEKWEEKRREEGTG